ncbi:2-amino-4-hydroxy-6-hydroxymethyldihydropteridine diphosphokinase [Caldifermentibacillus hisashii]|uniref:2-amino-4-hydroxy-6- hydroxymethyldihydropteridine diphosphokinase n=1 Tax=Caldifermentibacillus hisashii TaxID=996558 RepID=UPI000BA34844|nr:2-amino-4-hydroxy-6-hydroxymethyldihydropteridine diphosphokinase [Caldifermentibacillus hisashii]PAC34608.1 2-amino-4-hydroxy-6-hydroxymethyldihydropteridine diphosphokinase [Caldifermentibacillus hisashii]
MKNRAFLSLGSNLGKREDSLYNAIKQLEDSGHITVVNYSSIYETDPVGYTEQNSFLNMVIEIATDYQPTVLLESCLEIEKRMGRTRIIRWGPRNIDIDILLFNDQRIETEKLQIPHPRMGDRAFVLVPLQEIDSEIIIPGINQTINDMVERLSTKGVRLWKQKSGEDVYELFGN